MTALKGAPSYVPTNITPGLRTVGMVAGANRLKVANAARKQCPHCPLMISPEGYDRHVRICADDDTDA